jgi:hypothetical protein
MIIVKKNGLLLLLVKYIRIAPLQQEVCMCMCMYVCMCMYLCACMYVCTYVYVCVCMCGCAPTALVPIHVMTGLGTNGDMCPKKVVQKVSILDSSYLRQYRCSYCNGAQSHIP